MHIPHIQGHVQIYPHGKKRRKRKEKGEISREKWTGVGDIQGSWVQPTWCRKGNQVCKPTAVKPFLPPSLLFWYASWCLNNPNQLCCERKRERFHFHGKNVLPPRTHSGRWLVSKRSKLCWVPVMRAILKSRGCWRGGTIPRANRMVPAIIELEETKRKERKNSRWHLGFYLVTTVFSSNLENTTLCLIKGGKY